MSTYRKIPYANKSLVMRGVDDAIRKLLLDRGSYTSVVIELSGHVDIKDNPFLQKRTADFYVRCLRLASYHLRGLPKRWATMVYLDDKITLYVYNVDKDVALGWSRKHAFEHKLISEYRKVSNGKSYYMEYVIAEYGEAKIHFSLPLKEVK